MASARLREPTPVRWGLRLLAIVYVFLLVLWPVSLVVKYTFADGLTALSTALTDPDVIHALQLTAVVALSAVRDQPGLRRVDLDPAGALRVPRQAGALGAASTCRCRSRRSWSVSRWCSPTTRAPGCSAPRLDAAGIQVIFATPGMIMATAFVALPLVIREVVPVLSEIGDEQEQASRSLGANARQTFRRITLPSIKWAVVYGVVLTLARSLGEFGAVKVVSGNIVRQTQTATLVVESKYQGFDQDTAYATAFLLATASVICIVVVSLLRPKERVMSIEIKDVNKRFGDFVALRRRVAEHPDRPADRPARPVRRRQVHAAADHRRPRVGRLRDGQHRGHRGHPPAAAEAQRRLRVPALRGLQAHDAWRRTSPSAWRSASAPRPRSRARVDGAARARAPLAVRRTGCPPSSPAASASGWRWPARSRSSRRCCCSTSRSARSTPRSARSCATGCAGCTTRCT